MHSSKIQFHNRLSKKKPSTQPLLIVWNEIHTCTPNYRTSAHQTTPYTLYHWSTFWYSLLKMHFGCNSFKCLKFVMFNKPSHYYSMARVWALYCCYWWIWAENFNEIGRNSGIHLSCSDRSLIMDDDKMLMFFFFFSLDFCCFPHPIWPYSKPMRAYDDLITIQRW